MDAMTIPAIDPDEIIGFMNIDRTDYGSFSRAQQIRHFEVEGYVVLPDMLDAGQIARLKTELADVPMEPRPLQRLSDKLDHAGPVAEPCRG